MARFLVLDWDYQQLQVVSAVISRGRVQILKAVALREEKSPNPAEAEALGRLLRERLKVAGIAPAPVLVCVGRDRVILKDVRHPPVPANEEPAIIRFQVVKELNDPAEEVVIDYTAGPETGAGAERRALAVVVRRELVSTYRTLCGAAGLKLVGLTPRPFGVVACLQAQLGRTSLAPTAEPVDGAIAILTIGQPWVEFCVVRGDSLLIARSLAVSPNLAADVRRNLAVYAAQNPQSPVRAIYIADNGEHEAARERVHNLTELPVHAFDPFGGVEGANLPSSGRSAFAGAVGLLHAQARKGAQPINFLYPKEPKKATDPRRNRILAVAALVAVLLLGGISVCYSQLSERSRRLQDLFDERTSLEQQLSKLDEDSKRLHAVDEWDQSDIVWLDELYDLTDRFPDPTTLRLMQLNGEPLARSGKDKHVARLTLKGITTNEYQSVDILVSKLVEDGHYRVEPKVLSRNSGADRFRFPQQFATRMDMENRLPSQYVRRIPNLLERTRPGQPVEDEPGDFGFGGLGGFGGQP